MKRYLWIFAVLPFLWSCIAEDSSACPQPRGVSVRMSVCPDPMTAVTHAADEEAIRDLNLTIALANKMDYHLSALWEGGHIKFWSRRTLAILLREAGYHHLVFTGAGRIPYLWRHMVFSARV